MTRPASLLIVDDNESNRDVLQRRLRHAGFEASVAEDGHVALARIEREAFDLILLDVEMPGISGLQVLEQLRVSHSQTELPVIMVTARSEGADIVEAFRLGANDYVTKPIDFPVALARISTHLAHKRAVEDLRASQERYALAMHGANEGLWDWDLTTNRVHWSSRWKAMLGYADDEIGEGADEWFARVHRDDLDGLRSALAAHLDGRATHVESEHRVLHHNGTYRWMLCRGGAVRNAAGTATRLLGSLTDITDTKIADALTGLPNRFLFVDVLERALKRTERRKDYTFALLVLGLDRFKVVRDGLGSLMADRFLAEVARRLHAGLRGTDVVASEPTGFTLARLGGDEFSILLDDVASASDAVRVGERLRLALQKPFELDGHQVYVSASVGIAMSGTGYRHPEDILRDAATALHRAAAEGGTGCEIFDEAMRERAVTRLRIESDLQNAITDSSFVVHYQPLVSLPAGDIIGFEALLRWPHAARGLIRPDEFIPVAEDTGMLIHIGQFVLTESCRQMAEWIDRFGPDAPRFVCVNVSVRQFADPGLVAFIESTLGETGLDGKRLHLEITETAFIGDEAAAQDTLRSLKALGIEWGIDDFGTGYSSLSYLHRLQAGFVKVDRSFVSRMGHQQGGSDMVRSIVALARNLGMAVVAEGVETAEQLHELRLVGCDFAQGFHFSKAVDAETASRLLRAQPWRVQSTMGELARP